MVLTIASKRLQQGGQLLKGTEILMKWLIVFFLALSALSSRADSSSSEIELAKQKLLDAEKTERQILGTLFSITQRMKDMSKKRDRLTDRRLASESDVQVLAKQIAELEIKLENQSEEMRVRIRRLYQLNGQATVRLLFSSQSSVEWNRNVKFLKRLTLRDRDVIQEYQKSIKHLLKQKSQLKNEVKTLTRIQRDLKNQEIRLSHDQEEKNKLLSQLHKTQSLQLQQIAAKRSSVGKIVEQMGDQVSFFEKRGQLRHPIQTPIIKKYGYIQDEVYKFRLGHKGWFYSGSKSDPIRAVFKGKVIFAGQVDGYGKATIIDHGDHYYTLYAFLNGISVKVGDEVDDVKVLGWAGGQSPWFGNGMYFEIRHFSDAIDPQQWIQNI